MGAKKSQLKKRVGIFSLFIAILLVGGGTAYYINMNVSTATTKYSEINNVSDSANNVSNKQGDVNGGVAIQGNVSGDIVQGDKITVMPDVDKSKEKVLGGNKKEQSEKYDIKGNTFNGPTQLGDGNTMEVIVTKPIPRTINATDKKMLALIPRGTHVTLEVQHSKECTAYATQIAEYLEDLGFEISITLVGVFSPKPEVDRFYFVPRVEEINGSVTIIIAEQ